MPGRGWALFAGVVLFLAVSSAVAEDLGAPVDLTRWNTDSDPVRALEQGWMLRQGYPDAPPVPVTLPQRWPQAITDDISQPRFGEAWYQIRLRLPPAGVPLALRVESFKSALAVYADGELLARRGTPGNLRTEVVDTRPLLVRLPRDRSELRLTLHVSNHFHGSGGVWTAPVIGDHAWLEQQQELRELLMAGIIGGMVLLALYLLALAPRKRIEGAVPLALLLMVVAMRIAAVEHFLGFLPGGSAEWRQRLAYLAVFLVGPLVFQLLRSLFPRDLHWTAGVLVNVFGLSGAIASLTMAVPRFTQLQTAVAFVVMGLAGYYVWRVVVAVIRRRPGARQIAIGTAIMAAAVCNDSLLYAGYLNSVDMVAYGLLAFVGSHALVLGGRLLDALSDNEVLNTRLATLNRNLENAVDARTRDLASQSDLLATTLESMDPALLAMDGQGRVVAFNNAFLGLFTFARREVSGSSVDGLRGVLAERENGIGQPGWVDRLLPRPGEARAGRSDLTLPNGEVIEVSRRSTALGGYVATFQDVTALRVAELGPEGGAVGIWDRDLRVGSLVCSDRYWSMLGYDPRAVPSEVLHRHATDWLSVVHPDDRRMADAVSERCLRGDMALLYNCRIQRRDGDWLWVTVRGEIIRNESGAPVRIVGTQTDIDAIVHAQETLRKARDFAETDARHKSRFLASLSHELRTPLHGMLGNLQLLESETEGERLKRVQAIRRAGESLVRLMDAILESARAEAGRLTVREENFAPRRLLNEVVELMEPLASQKGLSLVAEVDDRVPPWLLGGEVQLRQILMNLVGNAVKFTDEGRISLEVTCDATNRYTFAVADSGRGLTEPSLKRIFEEYYQDDPSAEAGAGLGLFIVRRLSEALNGVLDATSEPGSGSRFSLTLNLPVGGPVDADHQPRVIPGPFRLLLVEDVAVNRVMTRELLARDGHAVTAVDGGEAALDALKRERFDAVLMDIRLHGMDGVETTRRIRAMEDPSISAVPVIALTANADDVDAAFRASAGIDAVAGKPVRLTDLYRRLDALCNRGRGVDNVVEPEQDKGLPDNDRLRELLAGVGPEHLHELLGQLELTFEEQRACLAERPDRAGIGAIAHRLEGAAANFGVDAVEDAARAVRRAEDHDLPGTVRRLEKALDDAVPMIRAWQARLNEDGGTGPSMEVEQA